MNDFEATEIVRTVSIDRRLKNIVCGRRLLISRGHLGLIVEIHDPDYPDYGLMDLSWRDVMRLRDWLNEICE